MLRNRFGGVGPLVLYSPDGVGSGAGDGGSAAAAGAAGGAASEGGSAAAGGASAGNNGAAAAAGSNAEGAAGSKGALASGAAAAAQVAVIADFPADWREKLSGGDETKLSTMKRYASPQAWAEAHFGLVNKMSKGELKAPVKPPEANATPEQVAAWRKEQGLPEKAADYVAGLKLPNGFVPGEADKPLLGAVAEMAHKANYDQKTVNDFVGMYYNLQDQITAQRQEQDQQLQRESHQQIIKQMGADFEPNMVALSAFWKEQPEGMLEMVLGARTPDGKIIGNLPEVTSFFTSIARELNPASTLLPPGGDTSAQGIASRMAEIEKNMYVDGKQNPTYFGGPLQEEYRKLIEAQERMNSRRAA